MPRPDMRMLSVYLLGVFIGALDTNVLGPTFPLIAGDFHVSLGWVAWTISAYTVSYVAVTVIAGAVGDRFGRRRIFTWGIVAFAVASLLAIASQSFWVFLLARVVQGAGAGAVYPNAQAAGVAAFPPERRGTALGIFGAVFGLAAIIGPNLGGALGQFFGWRSIFALNVPIAVIVLLMTPRLPESERDGRGLPDAYGGFAFGALLASALLAIMVSTPILHVVFALLALLLFAAFLYRQRTQERPFLDSKPLSSRAGVTMMIGAALIGLDMSAAVFVPTLAQRELGFGVLASGVALMPAALTGAVLAGLSGVLVDRMGPRGVLQIGLLAAALGGGFLAVPHMTMGIFVVAMMFLGLGTAFTMGAPLNRMALALYRDNQSGEALSLVAVFRAVGLAAGPILLTLAQSVHGFTGMYGCVVVASLIGLVLYFFVPDVRTAAGRVRPRSA